MRARIKGKLVWIDVELVKFEGRCVYRETKYSYCPDTLWALEELETDYDLEQECKACLGEE